MGTSSEIIILNGKDTKSFYVGFGSHEDDLGQRLKKYVNQTTGENWKDELIQLLKNDDEFIYMRGNEPTDITYLVNNEKQLLFRNRSYWKEI